MTTLYDIDELKRELAERDAIIARQRVIIEKYNRIVEYFFMVDGKFPPVDEDILQSEIALREAYEAAQDTTTMTGVTEE